MRQKEAIYGSPLQGLCKSCFRASAGLVLQAESERKVKAKPANLLLEKHLRELALDWVSEHKFCPERNWRFDYWIGEKIGGPRVPSYRVAIEIEGGVYTQGRHVRGKGYEADLCKYNEAARLGWTVFRFSTGQVLRGEARDFLQRWLGREGGR